MVTKEFAEEVAARIRGMMAGEVKAEEVEKNNGVKRLAIVIKKKNEELSPVLYLDEFKGATEQEMAEEIIEEIEKRQNPAGDFSIIGDWERAKEKIVFELVNKEKNEERLKDVPHKNFLDFAIIFEVVIESENYMEAMIKNDLMNHYGVNVDDLMKEAEKNTPVMRHAKVEGLGGFLHEVTGIVTEPEEEAMWIVTNDHRYRGAAAVLYDGVIESLADRLGSDLWMLPSSVHEWIVIKAEEPIEASRLGEIVKEVNISEIPDQDILGDYVYFYDRQKGEIRRWRE